jgi:hypothetical protein
VGLARDVLHLRLATLIWLLPWRQTVRPVQHGHFDRAPGAARPDRQMPLWAMSIGHCAGNYCFISCSRGCPVPDQGAASRSANDLARTIGYAVQAVCALSYGSSLIGGRDRAGRRPFAAAG